MAPGLIETPQVVDISVLNVKPVVGPQSPLSYIPGRTVVEQYDETYEHEDLRPNFPDVKWTPLEEHDHHDKGLLGDPQFKSLLKSATDIRDYNPKIGTEIHGIDLANLTDAQKNDLARLIATRGVVFFRNQKNFDIDAQRKLGQYFGRLHSHATTATPRREGLEDVHVVFSGEDSPDLRALFKPSFLWHSDVTYEVQPPSYTSLKVLTGPPRGGGGDTLWSSQYAAYDQLSAPMQKYLEGLTAIHSAHLQAQGSRELGRTVRREPINTEHPLVRTNPVTGWKALFFNPGFVTKIVGIPKTESDFIISYLNEIVATSPELHARFQWNKGDVAFWDNRVCVGALDINYEIGANVLQNHTATYGFAPHRRHAVRVCAQAEKPYLDPNSRSQEDDLHERHGIPKAGKDGAGIVNYND